MSGSGRSDRRATPAAGAVVWRRAGDRLEVALVHRPRYDDWTLPKGKLHSGEQTLLAAVREVGEETGGQVEVGRRLSSVEYRMADDSIKKVSYWAMRWVSGEHTPDDEVDCLQWLTIAEATQRLTYPMDRGVLADFARLPAPTGTVVLVRHAKAGRRSEYKGEDRLRPLDKIGRRHARESAALLAAFGPRRLASADKVRCEQTITPLAGLTGLPIDRAPEYSDEVCAQDAAGSAASLLALVADGGCSVICSQGGAIPAMLVELGVPGQPHHARKGSAWVLSFAQAGLISADYYPHPNT